MRYLSGEMVYAWMGTLLGSLNPFGPQRPYREVIECDPDINPFDRGIGWEQGVKMDRGEAAPPGTPVSAFHAPDPDYLALGRVTGNPSDQVAPLLFREALDGRFGSEVRLIDWAQETAVVRSYGLGAPVIAEMLPQVAKQQPDYDYSAKDSQAILEDALSRVRRSLYGR